MSFGVPECANFPERQERPNVLEYTAAELWVRQCYSVWFAETMPDPQLVTWQLERFFFNYAKFDKVIDLVMTTLESDYNNVLNPALVKKFYRLMNTGGSETELIALLKEITPGGARKPDMLGISASRTLLFDSVEVGTVKTAKSTYDELNEKMAILRDVIVPLLKIQMPQLAIDLSRGVRSVSVPVEFKVMGSAFRLSRAQRILPLPVRIGKNGSATTVDWICFHPSVAYQPAGAPGTTTGGEPTGVDGLFLYHIHRATLPQLPEKVRQYLEQSLRKWKQQQGLVLELNPALAFAFQQSTSDWAPEARMLFAYAGLGALVVLGVGLACELGLVAGGAAVAQQGIGALAATPALFASAVSEALSLARFMWPVAISVSQWLPAGP